MTSILSTIGNIFTHSSIPFLCAFSRHPFALQLLSHTNLNDEDERHEELPGYILKSPGREYWLLLSLLLLLLAKISWWQSTIKNVSAGM